MTIGERAYKAISDRADQAGVGIVAYAKSIGISQPNLTHWKNAHSEPRAYLLSLLAEAGLDVHWILTGQETDKVDVVRCRECRLYEMGVEYYGGGTKDICRLFRRQEREDSFCAHGERRADNAAD